MPFQSEKQRRYLHANHPEIANRWEAKYGLGGIAELNSQLNSLPEYYMPYPAAQGGRIGFDKGTISPELKKRMLELLLQGVPPHKLKEEAEKQLKQDPYIKERMNIPGSPVVKEAAHGGLIPSHEAGIYGLAEGGRTGFYKGSDRHAGTGSSQSQAPASGPHGNQDTGSSNQDTGSSGNGPYQNVHQTGAVSKTPGRIPTPETPGDTSIRNPFIDEDSAEVKKQQKKTDFLNEIRRQRGEKTETWEKEQNWQKPSVWGKVGQGLLTLATFGVLGPGAAKLAKYYNTGKKVKAFADTGKINLPFGKEIDLSNQLSKISDKLQSSAAEKDLYESLPDGHPEKISLQAKLEIGKEPPTADSENRGTNIVIDNIEEVNDAKTQLLRKYQEMDEASLLAWRRQQELEAKKQAYLRNFRKTYAMAAQGGRIPGGYNTGGLSNLFRLKNV
jgi:hypothetical protein